MGTEIKYTAGDEVYWLSSMGFRKGIVKQVILRDTISTFKSNYSVQARQKEITYLLWHDRYAEVYMGDEVKENEIFTSYDEMLEYYKYLTADEFKKLFNGII